MSFFRGNLDRGAYHADKVNRGSNLEKRMAELHDQDIKSLNEKPIKRKKPSADNAKNPAHSRVQSKPSRCA